MERKYDMDAIGYLFDPPSGLAAGWTQGLSRDRLQDLMRYRVAILRRELEDLESDLRVLDAEEEAELRASGSLWDRLVSAFRT